MGDDGKSVVEEDWRIWPHSQIPQCCLAPATTSSQNTTLPFCRGPDDLVYRKEQHLLVHQNPHQVNTPLCRGPVDEIYIY